MSEPVGFTQYVADRRDHWMRVACLLTGDSHAAEDLVQTALVRVWPRWGRVSARGDADAYVRTVLVNVYLTGLRRRRWREVSADPWSVEASRHPTARAETDDVEQRLHLQRALSELAPRQRAVLVLRYYLDLSEADTAEMLGCSIGTVKSQAAKGAARLRSHIEAAAKADDKQEHV